MCFKVERTNEILSADAPILTSPSLQQSFEFHAKTDLAHRLARETPPFVELLFSSFEDVSEERSGNTQVRTSLRCRCIRPVCQGRTSHHC